VLAGRAGFYVGKFCDDCGPVGRATQYLYTRADAEKMLEYVVRITPTVREIAASWPPMYPHGLY
jgi:hypothetical protein